MRKTSPPPELDPRTFQPVAGHYRDYAIPDPIYIYIFTYIIVTKTCAIDVTTNIRLL